MIRHIHVSSCDSTQDLLKEQMTLFPAERLLVSCDHQERGRGRSDHIWYALPGSLCFSLVIDPHPKMSFTALEMSLLVARFFEERKLLLKWPNDLWNQQQKKCCGILVQNFNNNMVAGIGLNLFSETSEFGDVFDEAFPLDKKTYALKLANFILEHRYADHLALTRDWEARCGHLNQSVRITEGELVLEGIFKGLGADGEAVIETKEGRKHVYNGSLRPIV